MTRIADKRDGSGLLVARRPGVRDRLAARVRARRLDRDLAAGVHPEASPALALRARRLTAPPRRRRMAEGYRRLPRESRSGRLGRAGAELERLAETLAAPGPVTATGAAQAWLLLTDGTGALHNSGSNLGAQAAAARALQSLRLDSADRSRA